MIIRQLLEHDKPPMELLLSADPSREKVEAYLRRGECFAAFTGEVISGVYVLLPTRPDMVELVNVAVAEQYQGHGFFTRHYPEAIYENGILCRDMLRLTRELHH